MPKCKHQIQNMCSLCNLTFYVSFSVYIIFFGDSIQNSIPLQSGYYVQYGITIIPVVGMLSDKDAFSPVLNPAEVAAIFDVPLELFLKVYTPIPVLT